MATTGTIRYTGPNGEKVNCYWKAEPQGVYPNFLFTVEAILDPSSVGDFYTGSGASGAFTVAGIPNRTSQSMKAPPASLMTVETSFENGYLLDAPISISGAMSYWTQDDIKRTVTFTVNDIINITPYATGTVIQAEGQYLDQPVKIRLAPMSPTYTNTMTYVYGTQSGTIATKTPETTINWTPPTTLINGLPATATEGTLTITTTAYNGNTVVGTTTIYTMVLAANPATQGPVFSPVMTDTNSATLAVTGSATTIVAGKSTMKVVTGVTGRGLATVVQTTITTEDDYIEGTRGTLSKPSPLVSLYARDTRSFITERVYTPVKYINYFEPTAITDTSMSAAGVLTSKITGRWFNGSFGAVTNTITASFRYQVPGGSWSAWTNITLTVNNEIVTGTATVNGLNYRQRYDMEIRLVDKLTTVTIETSSMGTPVFDWSKTDFNFNVPVNFAAGATGASSAVVYTCNTVSTTDAKVLVGNNNLSVIEGTSIFVAFTHINLVNNVTFRIGVKTYPAISLNGTLIKAWAENSLVEFIYTNNAFTLVTRGDTQHTPTPVEDKEVVVRESILLGGNSFTSSHFLGDFDRLRIYARLGDRYTIGEIDVAYPRLAGTIKGGISVPTPDLVTSSTSTSITNYVMQFTINLTTQVFTLDKILQMKPSTSVDVTSNSTYNIYRIVGIKQ